MSTAANQTKTQVGDFLVWFSHEHNSLRMGRTAAEDMEFEVEAFTRPELSICHDIFAAK